jgi:hypothetical protein
MILIGGDTFIRIGGDLDSSLDMYVSQWHYAATRRVSNADTDFIGAPQRSHGSSLRGCAPAVAWLPAMRGFGTARKLAPALLQQPGIRSTTRSAVSGGWATPRSHQTTTVSGLTSNCVRPSTLSTPSGTDVSIETHPSPVRSPMTQRTTPATGYELASDKGSLVKIGALSTKTHTRHPRPSGELRPHPATAHPLPIGQSTRQHRQTPSAWFVLVPAHQVRY